MGTNYLAQTDALFKKNLLIQRRACKTNCCLISFPLLICLLLGGAQMTINKFYNQLKKDTPQINCGYCASKTNASFSDDEVGGLICPTQCPLPLAPKWLPALQLPEDEELELEAALSSSTDAPKASVRSAKSLPARFLFTGRNKSFAASVMNNMFPTPSNSSGGISALADYALGTNAMPVSSSDVTDGFGSAFLNNMPIYFLQTKCIPESTLSFPVQVAQGNITIGGILTCMGAA